MSENTNATEADAPSIATEEEVKVTLPTEEDYEAKNLALEAEKNRLIEESANYKLAYLKEKNKNRDSFDSFEEEDAEDKMRRIAKETLNSSRLAEINREQADIIAKALKENKELKRAQLNKPTTPPQTVGSHSEGIPVTDTLVTPEQMVAFKARGWTDKDIERYKKNLNKQVGR